MPARGRRTGPYGSGGVLRVVWFGAEQSAAKECAYECMRVCECVPWPLVRRPRAVGSRPWWGFRMGKGRLANGLLTRWAVTAIRHGDTSPVARHNGEKPARRKRREDGCLRRRDVAHGEVCSKTTVVVVRVEDARARCSSTPSRCSIAVRHLSSRQNRWEPKVKG